MVKINEHHLYHSVSTDWYTVEGDNWCWEYLFRRKEESKIVPQIKTRIKCKDGTSSTSFFLPIKY